MHHTLLEVLRDDIDLVDIVTPNSLHSPIALAAIQAGKHGEAIGLLRRAIGLGVDPKLVTPMLAESLHAREQRLAAMVCLEEAKSRGADESITAPLEAKLTADLADTWEALTTWLRS